MLVGQLVQVGQIVEASRLVLVDPPLRLKIISLVQKELTNNLVFYFMKSNLQCCNIFLSNNIQIYPGKPLRFTSKIGNLGKISVYIKSKDQIENEQCTIESDGYDSE